MPDNVTPERTQLLQMYGADIVYSPGEKGSNGAVEMALELAASDARYYMPYQYGNEANPRPTTTARRRRSSRSSTRSPRSWPVSAREAR